MTTLLQMWASRVMKDNEAVGYDTLEIEHVPDIGYSVMFTSTKSEEQILHSKGTINDVFERFNMYPTYPWMWMSSEYGQHICVYTNAK